MLELPEVVTIARQMDGELRGRRIASAVAGASPHKFAFLNYPAGDYAGLLGGRTFVEVCHNGGSGILAHFDDGSALLFDEMGGRILFCREAGQAPRKHQLLVSLAGGGVLAVSIALWGAIRVQAPGAPVPSFARADRISPLGPQFTFERFEELLVDPSEGATRSAKAFVISKPGFAGIGNGCTQDILYRARIHPRRRVAELSPEERRAFYDAFKQTIGLMVDAGGRDCERDLYDRPGGYHPILDSSAAGKPCPACGAPIVKISYLGGAAYFCPACQV